MSYQPEERYWTDYLRIALPVVGLLLMLGLFWYWASSVIGDNNDTPKATSTPNVIVATAPTQTATVLEPATDITAKPATETPPAGATDAAGGEPTQEGVSGGDQNTPASDGNKFAEGDNVVTTESANMRSGPSVDDDVVILLESGAELTVTGPAEKGGDYTWIPVTDAEGNEGYVADEFLSS